jgi:hypothetical protein
VVQKVGQVSVANDGDLGQTFAMTTALDLLSMDRFERSLQLAGAVPHFPALDLMKGLADPSCATSSTPSLFGPGHALAGREVLESLTIVSEPGSMLKQKLSKTMRAEVDCQPGPSHSVGHGNRREAGDTCHGAARLTGDPEVISSPIGLVPTNALAVTVALLARCRLLRSYRPQLRFARNSPG